MADQLPTNNYYTNLGGINAKASKYEMQTAQFLDLRNLDFDVPNALQKRPGSSLYAAQSLSGPVLGLFEFQKLLTTTGVSQSDFIIANANGNVFYNSPSLGTAFTLLSQGYGATQPVDFAVFGNKSFMANGTKWEQWDGATLLRFGVPLVKKNTAIDAPSDYLISYGLGNTAGSGSYFLVNGATYIASGGGPCVTKAIYLAYSYNRLDGYGGPADFQTSARNIINPLRVNQISNGTEFFGNTSYANIAGFTVPSGAGITSISIWFAEDTIEVASAETEYIPSQGNYPTGQLGWAIPQSSGGITFWGHSITLKPDADLTRFQFYTAIPTTALGATTMPATGVTVWCFPVNFAAMGTFGVYDSSADPAAAFSAMTFDFFSTFTPKYLAINQNRMFAAGFSSSPSTTWWSEIGAPETYNPDSSFEARTDDGDRIYAIETYNNELLIMKQNSFHRLIGDSADNFQLLQVSDQYGCISNKSVVKYDQKIYWLDSKGILEYYGANHSIVSEPVEGIFRRMNLSAAKEYAVGVHHKYRNQLWWGIPVDGSTVNNLTVVYDYLVGAWTFFDGFNPASFASMRAQLSRPTAWRGDYSGFVHFFGESFYNDSGQGISCTAFTRFEAAGENNTWLWRRVFLDVGKSSGSSGSITGKVFSDYDQTTVMHTFTTNQSSFQSRAEMGVNGKAVAVEFGHYSASLPLLINGYGLAKRPLRNV